MVTLPEFQAIGDVVATSDQAFYESLLSQWQYKGQLSDKQMLYVQKLIDRAALVQIDAPDPIDIKGLLGMFYSASTKLKYPRITAPLVDGTKLVLHPVKGQGDLLCVREKTQHFNKLLGVLYLDRVEVKERKLIDVWGALVTIAADPAAALGAIGKLNGFCCFCMLPLSDERSTAVGYGPVCAKNWMLPWGDKSAPASLDDLI